MHSPESPFLSPADTRELAALESLWGAESLRCALPHRPGTIAGHTACSGSAVALFRTACHGLPDAPGCAAAVAATEAFLTECPRAKCPDCRCPAADCWERRPF